ncbi:MAG: hypothetical protein LAQ30_04865, partial [Acidobacteriia bacterium]|nr:hypothetical protein [Terriglobia bacterium]
QKAKEMINRITEEVEVGKIYMGTVRKIMDFDAFVEDHCPDEAFVACWASPCCNTSTKRPMVHGLDLAWKI